MNGALCPYGAYIVQGAFCPGGVLVCGSFDPDSDESSCCAHAWSPQSRSHR